MDFNKLNGIIPAIIQDARTNTVLMLGFMNPEALEKTRKEGRVTFFSRTKNRLWTKGEESGNFLNVVEILEDLLSQLKEKENQDYEDNESYSL